MSRFDDHPHSMRIELRLQGFSDLHGQPLLNLQPSRKHVHDARNLAESHHLLIGQIAHMNSAVERQQVMLAHAEEIDVFHNDHLVVLDREERAVQEMIDVAMITLGHEGEGLGHSLGSLEESTPGWLLTESQ